MDDVNRIITVGIIFLMTATFFTGCIEENGEENVLKIYHAGSLSVPFDEIEKKFEEKHPDIDVRREAAGSVATVRKVTDQGKKPDIVGVADYSLIPNMMYEENKANWTVRFARNRMVLAYTDSSLNKDDVSKDNWYEILDKEGVSYGFANPNDDPCGYRSQMVIKLAENHYDNDHIFDDLVGNHTGIEEIGKNISAPEDLDIQDSDEITVRSKETDLLGILESGNIDYLFIYQSVAEQHDLDFVQLPEQIDLSSVEYAEEYEQVTLKRHTGEKSIGKPIVYGLTIPSTVKNKDTAIKFVKFLLNETGRDVMSKNGQPPIDPPQVDHVDRMPKELENMVESS